MKILSFNQYIEKLSVNPMNMDDLNSIVNPQDVINYYMNDFVSGDNSNWINFTDFSFDIINNNDRQYGLVFRRYKQPGNSSTAVLNANYSEYSECLEFALTIWGIGIYKDLFNSFNQITLKHLSGKFGFDYDQCLYNTEYIGKYISDMYIDKNLPNSEKIYYLEFFPNTCYDNVLFDLFSKTGDYSNEWFSTGLSCTDDFVTYDNKHLGEFSLIVRLWPNKELNKSNECMNGAIDCINHQYKILIDNFNKILDEVVRK